MPIFSKYSTPTLCFNFSSAIACCSLKLHSPISKYEVLLRYATPFDLLFCLKSSKCSVFIFLFSKTASTKSFNHSFSYTHSCVFGHKPNFSASSNIIAAEFSPFLQFSIACTAFSTLKKGRAYLRAAEIGKRASFLPLSSVSKYPFTCEFAKPLLKK